MPSKANQLPKGAKRRPAPGVRQQRIGAAFRSAAPIVAAGALLVIIIGIVLLSNAGRTSSRVGSPAQVSGQAKLAVDREQIDFGKVPLNKVIKATFNLSNIGDQSLRILNQPVVEVKQGC